MGHSEYKKTWVKQHKQEFANNLIAKSGAKPDKNPSAVFMAGLPGAGKTEFTKNLISTLNLNFIRLDMDEIATCIPDYQPKSADKYRSGASELLNRTLDLILKRKLSFIMDGTFGSPYAIKNVKRALKHGYRVKIIYLSQDPKLAWQFTLAREQIEHRAISQNGFIDTYFNTIDNIKELMLNQHNRVTLDIVIKSQDNTIGRWFKNAKINSIDRTVNYCDNKKTLGEYINAR